MSKGILNLTKVWKQAQFLKKMTGIVERLSGEMTGGGGRWSCSAQMGCLLDIKWSDNHHFLSATADTLNFFKMKTAYLFPTGRKGLT